MIQLRWQDAVAASMPWQKNHRAASQGSREQVIGWIAKRRFDSGPFLIGEALDMIKPAAANDPDPVNRHARFIAMRRRGGENGLSWFLTEYEQLETGAPIICRLNLHRQASHRERFRRQARRRTTRSRRRIIAKERRRPGKPDRLNQPT